MEDKRIPVGFDVHETLLRGIIGFFLKVYKGDRERVDKICDIVCNYVLLVTIYTLFTLKDEKTCQRMKDLYEKRDVFKVFILTNSHKSCKNILNLILKMKGIYYFEDIICRDYTFENAIDHKVKKIKEYKIQFFIDDRPDILKAIAERTDCLVSLVD